MLICVLLKYFSKLESDKVKRIVFVVDNEVFMNGKYEKLLFLFK